MTRNGKTRTKHALAGALIGALLAGGCSLDGPTSSNKRSSNATPRMPKPAPREVEPVEGAQPVQILLVRGTPTDSDADGYPDTIPALVYLFPDPTVSAMSVWAEGEFEFRLLDGNQRPVANWVFPRDKTASARRKLQPGPAYSFFLRLGGRTTACRPRRSSCRRFFGPIRGGGYRARGRRRCGWGRRLNRFFAQSSLRVPGGL